MRVLIYAVMTGLLLAGVLSLEMRISQPAEAAAVQVSGPQPDFAATAMFNMIRNQYADGYLSLTSAADMWQSYVEGRGICAYEVFEDRNDPDEVYLQRRGDWVSWFRCICFGDDVCILEGVTPIPVGVCAPVDLCAREDTDGLILIWTSDCEESHGCRYFDLDDAVNANVVPRCGPC